jgi:hypothetical protein
MELRLREGAAIEDIDGELVIVTEDGDAAVMNETAGLVLREILKHNDTEEITEKLVATFDIDGPTAERDLQAVLAELLEKELLQAR